MYQYYKLIPSQQYIPPILETNTTPHSTMLHSIPRPLKVFYYVTGHGYGHGTRAIATIQQLLSRGHSVYIITSASHTLFKEVLTGYPHTCIYRYALVDPGVSQKDAVTVDKDKTMVDFRRFMTDLVNQVEQEELQAIQHYQPDIICLDASFLPAKLARQCAIPAVIISNFTFDEIYSAMIMNPMDKELVQQCITMYQGATQLIRLPGFIRIPSFQHRPDFITDIPLVVRRARMSPIEVRQVLGIQPMDKFVLISFGGHELFQTSQEGGWTEERVLPPGWIGVVIGPGRQYQSIQGSRLLSARSEDWYMPDLINACQVVLSKCGYGMCSETVAHRKPLIYVPRPSFVEEEGLLGNLMKPYGHAIEMPQSDFYQGHWKEYIEKASLLDFEKVPILETNGDAVAANLIENLCK